MLAAQLNELGVSQGPEAPPRPNRQHKGPAASSTSNLVQPVSSNDQNSKQMPQSSSILDQVSINAFTLLFHSSSSIWTVRSNEMAWMGRWQ